MDNSKKTLIFICASLYGLFLSTVPAYALSVRNGNTVRIPKNETVNESVFLGGNSINIDGTVDGDVFCGGQDIEITGTVNGDVICAGQSIVISGQVKGNIRSAGQKIVIAGTVDRNVNVFGQNITISSGSAILGEVYSWSKNVDIEGMVGKKFSGGAQSVTINGIVNDVNLAAEDLSVGSTAHIKNNLIYVSNTDAAIASSESIQGKVVKQAPPKNPKTRQVQRERVWNSFLSFASVASLLAQIIVACVMIYFVANRTLVATVAMQEKILPTGGFGLLMLIVVPLIVVLFVITIIGIPVAMLLLLLYIFSFLVSRILVATVVGHLLLQQFWTQKKDDMYWSSVIGLILLWFVFSIPFIGGIVSFISMIWGLGGVYYLLKE